MAFKISPEVRLGEIMTVASFLLGGTVAYGHFTAEMAVVKQGQAAQADTNREIRTEIREVKQNVKEQDSVLRSIETKVNRARL